MRKDSVTSIFHFDPWNPDVVQAEKPAKEWRDNRWRTPLFCFIANGFIISSEEHRKALLQEIECNMKVVKSAVEYFHVDEMDKLRNLRKYLEVAKVVQRRKSGKKLDEKGEKERPDVEFIF